MRVVMINKNFIGHIEKLSCTKSRRILGMDTMHHRGKKMKGWAVGGFHNPILVLVHTKKWLIYNLERIVNDYLIYKLIPAGRFNINRNLLDDQLNANNFQL